LSAFVVGGLVLGGIYAISAVGLVLTYTSSRVFNFAHGAIAFFVAYFYYWLNSRHDWPIIPSALVTIGIVSPLVGLVLWAVLFRQLTNAPPAVRLVATVGLYVALTALTLLIFQDEEVFGRPPGLAPEPIRVFHIGGVAINANQLAVVIAAAVIAAALAFVLRLTTFGLAVRATVDSPRMAGVAGTNTAAVTAGSWMIGTTLAGLAGVLLMPILGLSQLQFTLLLIASFAAVVIGRMTSLTLAFAGAVGLGLLQQILIRYQPDRGVFATGIRPSIPFAVMLLFLIIYSYTGLGRERFEVDTHAAATAALDAAALTPRPPSRWRRALPGALFAVFVLTFPLWVDDFWLGVLAQGLALAIAFLSFTVVTGEGGMVSLCQITFAGVGGVVTAQLATEAGWSVLAAVVVAGLCAVPFGLLVALPALRLGDLYLALATLAFGLLMDNLFFAQERFDHFGSGVPVPRPLIGAIEFGNDTAFFYLLAAVFAVVAVLVVNLRRSSTGLVLASVRTSEPAAATLGISITRAKLIAFAFSAFIAGLGGGLYVSVVGRATVTSFNVVVGIIWLAIVVTWGVRSTIGALLAGLAFVVFPQLPAVINQTPPSWWGDVTPILFGLGAILVAREPRGVVFDTINRHRERRANRLARREGRREALAA
jgi:branched-chain amino acid transport system permease protein